MLRIRPPRFYRILPALLVVFTTAVAGTVAVPRVIEDDYRCLRFSAANSSSRTILDMTTGSFALDRRPLFEGERDYVISVSPDGQYRVVNRSQNAPRVIYPRLYLDKIGGASRVLETDVSSASEVNWHPQGEWLSYLWYPVVRPATPNAPRPTVLPSPSPAPLPRGPQLVSVRTDGSDRRAIYPGGTTAYRSFVSLRAAKDASFMAFYSDDGKQRSYRFWSLPDLTEKYVIPSDRMYYRAEWSPQGHLLALIEGLDFNVVVRERFLHIIAPETGIVQSFALSSEINSGAQLIWSPDGKYLAMQFRDTRFNVWMLNVYGVDGSQYTKVYEQASPSNTPIFYWRSDSRSIIFTERTVRSNRIFNLRQFFLEDRRFETVITDIVRPPLYSQRSVIVNFEGRPFVRSTLPPHLAVLSQQPDGKRAFDVIPAGTAEPVRVVSDATDMGDPYWLPNSDKVAVVWATGRTNTRLVKATIFDIGTHSTRTLDDSFWNVRDLRWVDQGKRLAYVISNGDGFAAELADLNSEEKVRLTDKMQQITNLLVDARTNRITFLWRDFENNRGVDVYDSNGTRLGRFRVTQLVDPVRYLVSPDGQYAAFKTGTTGTNRLEIVSANNEWSKEIRSKVWGMGDPLWSPDGKFIAFTQSAQPKPGQQSVTVLQVVNPEGNLVFEDSRFRGLYSGLSWSKCD